MELIFQNDLVCYLMRRGSVLPAFKLSLQVQKCELIEIELACCQNITSKHFLIKAKYFVVGRIRTCAGRPQWISSPSP